MKEPKLIQILNLVTDEKNFTNPQRGRVYSPDGIAPALNTCGGAVSNRRLLFGCAMRGRNPDNPKDRKTKSNGTFRQMIEIGKFGISNTITSMQKDSLVAEVCQKNKCSDCQGLGMMQAGLSISTSVTSPIRSTHK